MSSRQSLSTIIFVCFQLAIVRGQIYPFPFYNGISQYGYNPLMYDNLNGYGLYGANFLNNPFMDASIYTNPTLSGLNALGAMNGLDNFGTLNGLSGFPTFNVQNPIGANTNFGSTRLSGIDQLNLGNPIASYNAGRTHRLPSATRLQGAVTGCANLDYRPCQTEEYKTRGAGTIWENTRDFH